jgi:hypothetical protein
MSEEKRVVMESGHEQRALAWGVTPRSKAYVREESKGDPTTMSFDAAGRTTPMTFEPTDGYPLADVAHTVESHADDCFITDFEDALKLWEIPYTRDEKIVPLVAQPRRKKSSKHVPSAPSAEGVLMRRRTLFRRLPPGSSDTPACCPSWVVRMRGCRMTPAAGGGSIAVASSH